MSIIPLLSKEKVDLYESRKVPKRTLYEGLGVRGRLTGRDPFVLRGPRQVGNFSPQ